MKITAKKIAEMLNVSPTTVSFALNNKPGVSEPMRQKILSIAAENGLKVSSEATNVESSKTIAFIIYVKEGLVINEISFHSIVLQGIESKAKDYGYSVMVQYYYENEDIDVQLSTSISNVDGIIVLGSEFTDNARSLEFLQKCQAHCPVVIVDGYSFKNDLTCIKTDNVRGAYRAIEYLYNAGHRNIGVFTSKQMIPNFGERAEGIQTAAANLPGLTITDIPINFSINKSYLDITNWISTQDKIPTAYFAYSDIIAFGAIRAFTQMGYSIPEDISIIGFDDMPACEMVSPQLTTIRVRKIQLGSIAVGILADKINGASHYSGESGMNSTITLTTEIKERQSVSAPKKQ